MDENGHEFEVFMIQAKGVIDFLKFISFLVFDAVLKYKLFVLLV